MTLNMVEILLAIVGFLVVFGSSVAWLVRLEMKVRILERTHAECRAKREVQEGTIQRELTKIGNLLVGLRKDIDWMVRTQKNGGVHEEAED